MRDVLAINHRDVFPNCKPFASLILLPSSDLSYHLIIISYLFTKEPTTDQGNLEYKQHLPHTWIECGSEEIDVALHGPSFNMMNQDQAMQSCPELGCRYSHSWHSAPASRDPHSNTYQGGPLSQSTTPTNLLHRLDGRLRQAYFESPFGSSRSLSISSLDDSADDSRSQAGKERRRRARDSEVNRHHSNSSADNSASVPIMSAPAVHQGTRQLAVAGVVLGALELDRLSLMARVDEEKGRFRSKSKSKQKQKSGTEEA
ncbi:hypothetical protein FPOA_08660 [Fusarium poae]|uniref:Uncharacterized protein n=1 Tax=Fusarium poae TaxID=36050 RepID=A0A1B8APM4_FUSPO|nr:hypothetical protein FPOA_08660 [Fusarium poae]